MKLKLTLLILAASLPFSSAHAQDPSAADAAADRARDAFMKVDTNSDGALDLAEWKAAGRRERGFTMIDADKDGKVTPAELRAAMAKYGK
jgi:Ca2+-binding EF-hand superfamily protein